MNDVHQARILIVDDNELIRQPLVEFLQEEGYTVEAAFDGHDALNRLQSFAPDAIVMDIEMPVMDGIAATRAIRDRLGNRELPVFAFTAVPDSLDRVRTLFTEVLRKPMTPCDVGAAIVTYLSD